MYQMKWVGHTDLLEEQVAAIASLFDREYQADYGPWDKDNPYGYAPHDYHMLVYQGADLVGHVGCQKRWIRVGEQEVLIAGIGGVLIASSHRKVGLGRQMLRFLLEQGRAQLPVSYFYLGCREAVVPFYQASGFTRFCRVETSLDRLSRQPIQAYCQQIMIAPGREALDQFPAGDIDLRGCAW